MNELDTVHGKFLELVRTQPLRLAIGSARGNWTYAELECASRSAAQRLLERGVQPCDVVVLDCERSGELIVLLLAVMRIGAVFLVLGERWPDAYKATVTAALPALHWVSVGAQRASAATVRELLGPKLRSHLEVTAGSLSGRECVAACLPDLMTRANWPMYLAATSGSTGRPKLVVGTLGPVVHFLDWYRSRFAFGAPDRFALLSGLGYDPMLRDIFTPLSCGASVWVPAPEDLQARFGITRWLQRMDITVMHTTPSLSALVFDSAAGVTLPELKVVALGGEPLTWRRAAGVMQMASNSRLVNFYGTTETPQAIGYHVVEPRQLPQAPSSELALVPLGGPIDDVELLLVDALQETCSTGDIGEICVRTRHHAQGYYGDPGLTAHRFTADPTRESADIVYRTGDLGYRNGNGEIVFVGRKDRQVKLGGNRLQLEEIEAVVREVAQARHAIAVLENVDEGQPSIACYVEIAPGSALTEEQIKRRLLTALPHYMLPKRIECVTALPLTGTGKVDLAALARLTAAPAKAAGSVQTSVVELHARLVAIWATVLEVAAGELSGDSNFFEVGGNSLLAGRFIAAMNAAFGARFAVTDVFVYPKIKDWVQVLAAGSSERSPLETGSQRNEQRGHRIAAARAARMKA